MSDPTKKNDPWAVKMKKPNRAPKVLATTLGVALMANMLAAPATHATTASGTPKLVEWSTEEVKKYFDAAVDWNLPATVFDKKQEQQVQPTGGSGGSAAPVVIHNSGFGWDDLLLYHMIFNSGSPYSSSRHWSGTKYAYDYRTNQPYKPQTYTPTTFQNKPVTGSTVPPKTSSGTGTFNVKPSASTSSSSSSSSKPSTSSSTVTPSSPSKSSSTGSGSIGGTSSSFSSSSKSSSSSSGG